MQSVNNAFQNKFGDMLKPMQVHYDRAITCRTIGAFRLFEEAQKKPVMAGSDLTDSPRTGPTTVHI